MGNPAPRVTAFCYRRQGLDGSAPTAAEAVASAIGVYAVNPSGPLSILARAPSATAADVLGLERAGRVTRLRAMRTSGFLVPSATAPLVAAATAQPIERFAWMLRSARVEPEGFEPAREAVLAAAAEPRTTRELRAAAGLDGVDVKWLVAYLAARGDLATLGAASVTANESRYLARRGPQDGAMDPGSGLDPGSGEDPNAARAWLAGAYLHAFGPARVEDLAWWAGFPRAAAAAAIAAHPTVDTGEGRLLLAEDLAAYEAVQPLHGELALPPKWDAWTMGYPVDGRDRFVDRDVHDRLFDGDGNALGAVLVDGRAAGAWIHRGLRGAMEVDLDLFEPPSPRLRAAVEARLGTYAAFLGYRSLRVRDVPSVVPRRVRVRRPLA
jgi:DNA glycosylase AlkZ-like